MHKENILNFVYGFVLLIICETELKTEEAY